MEVGEMADNALEARVDRLESILLRLLEVQVANQEDIRALAHAQLRSEERLENLAGRLVELVESIVQLTARVDDLTQRMERVEEQIARLTDRMSSLTGMMLESRYRERAHVYFNRLLRRVRVLSPDTLDRLLEDAEESGRLTPAESEDVRATDVLALGRRREDETEAYLAVEVSGLVEVDDVVRALRRAELLTRATGKTAVPVVAGERIPPEIDRIARQSGVWRVLDGVAVPPDTDLPASFR